MSARCVVVTDYTFPNLEQEEAAARAAGAEFVADQCRSADEVTEALAGATVGIVQFAPCTAAAVDGLAPNEPMKRFADTLVGFFGFGQIGRLVQKQLNGFGFSFAVTDPALSEAEAAEIGVRHVDTDTLLREADAISLYAPATPQTRHVINAERLKCMRRNAAIVNTSRGALIEPLALSSPLHQARGAPRPLRWPGSGSFRQSQEA